MDGYICPLSLYSQIHNLLFSVICITLTCGQNKAALPTEAILINTHLFLIFVSF